MRGLWSRRSRAPQTPAGQLRRRKSGLETPRETLGPSLLWGPACGALCAPAGDTQEPGPLARQPQGRGLSGGPLPTRTAGVPDTRAAWCCAPRQGSQDSESPPPPQPQPVTPPVPCRGLPAPARGAGVTGAPRAGAHGSALLESALKPWVDHVRLQDALKGLGAPLRGPGSGAASLCAQAGGVTPASSGLQPPKRSGLPPAPPFTSGHLREGPQLSAREGGQHRLQDGAARQVWAEAETGHPGPSIPAGR